MTDAARRAARRLAIMAVGMALCVWAAMAIALVAGEQGRLAGTRRTVAAAIAGAVSREYAGTTSPPAVRAAALARLAARAHGVLAVRVLDPNGRTAATVSTAHTTSAQISRIVRPFNADRPNGWRVAVTIADTTDHDLAIVLGGLLAGLGAGMWAALELLFWITATRLETPCRTLEQLAAAGTAGDYRLVPPPAGAGEIGDLGVALARFVGSLTLRRREVELLLNDARHDTYDPSVVTSAELWARGIGDEARFARADPASATVPGDPGLRRLLWYLTALLLGVMVPLTSQPGALVLVLASVLAGGRLLAWLPRSVGRRPAIAIAGGTASVAAWLIQGSAWTPAVALTGLAAGGIIYSATAGGTEPSGADAAAQDAGTLAAAAAGLGSAAILTLTAGPELIWLAPNLLSIGAAALAAFAIVARNEALEPPARTVFPTIAEFVGVLRVGPVAKTLVGLVLPAASFSTAVLVAALGQPLAAECVAAVAAGMWLAPLVAPRIALSRAAALSVRLLPGPALLALIARLQPIPTLLIAAACGFLAGLIWHLASAAVSEVARRERLSTTEQGVLLSAALWRGLGLLLPIGAAAVHVDPTAGAVLLGFVAAAGAVSAVARFHRPMTAT
jgi:hypothetical protein